MCSGTVAGADGTVAGAEKDGYGSFGTIVLYAREGRP